MRKQLNLIPKVKFFGQLGLAGSVEAGKSLGA